MRSLYRCFGLCLAVALALGTADVASGGQCKEWSKYKACNEQFIADRAICQRAKNALCWANQMSRLAHCNATKQTGYPDLQFQ